MLSPTAGKPSTNPSAGHLLLTYDSATKPVVPPPAVRATNRSKPSHTKQTVERAQIIRSEFARIAAGAFTLEPNQMWHPMQPAPLPIAIAHASPPVLAGLQLVSGR